MNECFNFWRPKNSKPKTYLKRSISPSMMWPRRWSWQRTPGSLLPKQKGQYRSCGGSQKSASLKFCNEPGQRVSLRHLLPFEVVVMMTTKIRIRKERRYLIIDIHRGTADWKMVRRGGLVVPVKTSQETTDLPSIRRSRRRTACFPNQETTSKKSMDECSSMQSSGPACREGESEAEWLVERPGDRDPNLEDTRDGEHKRLDLQDECPPDLKDQGE